MEFQEDLERDRSKRQLERATEDLLRATRSAWTEAAVVEQRQRELDEARFHSRSRRKSPVGERYSDSLYSRPDPRDPRQAHFQDMPNRNMMHHMGPTEDHHWPREYTTDAIQAMQNMSMNSHQDFLNFSTTTPRQYVGTNQWMPTAYPPQQIRAPPSAYRPPQNLGDIDLPLNVLDKIAEASQSRQVETTSVASQTAGLFYPSQRKIEQLEKELEEKAAYEKHMQERKPLLTEISPGKGYWRKQIDHICQHLKAHAQSNAEFRALVGEPKMGRMIASAVQEDRDEISFTLTFGLRRGKDQFGGPKLGMSTNNGYHTRRVERNHYSRHSDDEMSEDSFVTRSSFSTRGRRRTIRRTKPKKKTVPRVSMLDTKLLRQVGSAGDGSSTELQQLIDEGADPNCKSKNGLPALHLAAKNKHIDCIHVLVQAGADIDAKGPSSVKGNTALHEAVNLGSAGIRSVDALLSCGVDQKVKNDRGETAYEMATRAGYDNLVKRFAAALGQSQLQRMIRPRSAVQ